MVNYNHEENKEIIMKTHPFKYLDIPEKIGNMGFINHYKDSFILSALPGLVKFLKNNMKVINFIKPIFPYPSAYDQQKAIYNNNIMAFKNKQNNGIESPTGTCRLYQYYHLYQLNLIMIEIIKVHVPHRHIVN